MCNESGNLDIVLSLYPLRTLPFRTFPYVRPKVNAYLKEHLMIRNKNFLNWIAASQFVDLADIYLFLP